MFQQSAAIRTCVGIATLPFDGLGPGGGPSWQQPIGESASVSGVQQGFAHDCIRWV